jgi:hypothetical protein
MSETHDVNRAHELHELNRPQGYLHGQVGGTEEQRKRNVQRANERARQAEEERQRQAAEALKQKAKAAYLQAGGTESGFTTFWKEREARAAAEAVLQADQDAREATRRYVKSIL